MIIRPPKDVHVLQSDNYVAARHPLADISTVPANR